MINVINGVSWSSPLSSPPWASIRTGNGISPGFVTYKGSLDLLQGAYTNAHSAYSYWSVS